MSFFRHKKKFKVETHFSISTQTKALFMLNFPCIVLMITMIMAITLIAALFLDPTQMSFVQISHYMRKQVFIKVSNRTDLQSTKKVKQMKEIDQQELLSRQINKKYKVKRQARYKRCWRKIPIYKTRHQKNVIFLVDFI